MVGVDEPRPGIDTGTTGEQCLVCGASDDVRRHTVTVRDGTHTVPLCGDHHEYVRRDRPTGGDDSFVTDETRKVTARVPTALLEEVDERASELEVPRSELIRDCLRDGLYAAETDVTPEDFLVAVVETRLHLQRLQERLATQDGLQNGATRTADEQGGSDGDSSSASAPADGPATDETAVASDGRTRTHDADIEFLKQRIVRLESLLELALS
jgi:hypothetical protein